MPRKSANTVIDTIATSPALDGFFTKTPAAVTADDLDVVVEHFRRERAQWLDSVKKKMEKKGAKK